MAGGVGGARQPASGQLPAGSSWSHTPRVSPPPRFAQAPPSPATCATCGLTTRWASGGWCCRAARTASTAWRTGATTRSSRSGTECLCGTSAAADPAAAAPLSLLLLLLLAGCAALPLIHPSPPPHCPLPRCVHDLLTPAATRSGPTASCWWPGWPTPPPPRVGAPVELNRAPWPHAPALALPSSMSRCLAAATSHPDSLAAVHTLPLSPSSPPLAVLLPHREDVKLEHVEVSQSHLAVFERVEGLQCATVYTCAQGAGS